MAKKSIPELKEYFKAARRPTESQFGDLIDSFTHWDDPNVFSTHYKEKNNLRFTFPEQQADQAIDILLGNVSIDGWVEVEITGFYNFQNSVGVIKKQIVIGAFNDNSIWRPSLSRVIEASGEIVDNIYIGDIVWDNTLKQYKITIYHTNSRGNDYVVRLVQHSTLNAMVDKAVLSDVYTNPLIGQKKHYVHYHGNVGIKTKNPAASLDIQGRILFDADSPVVGGVGIKGYETMWARGYNFVSSDGTQNTGGFGAVGVQNNINRYYIGKYENQIVTFNPENRQSSFGGNIDVYGEAKSRSQRIFDYSPTIYLDRSENYGGYTQGIQTRLLDGSNNWFFGNAGPDTFVVSSGTYAEGRQLVINRNGNAAFQGKVEAKNFVVSATPTADYVFAADYNLRGINELEKFITEKNHLPEIPSAKEMTDNGLSIGDFQIKLLQKIEELTLYIIALKKEIDLKPN
ncbi:hypothetical protein BBH99_04045 [Chryseobacterium contaminans]|uniref:Uncharacterized protein n=1 Tax=Chryseobacterium contaminans TaxID=1423959 RepID=A0A1M7A0C2_9FLAO|nr:hypothetical protein [Chryseobacterium contaminans]OCA80505.1 hypothetical protein BBH99_04045 [Chryseobacterium contaminans]SHL36228.1 hypothetical protein SAMN05444407_103439 [Chryseobacterium contaminans]